MATRIINRPSIKIEVKDGKYKPFIFDNGKKCYLCNSDEPEPPTPPVPPEPTNRILYTVVEGGTQPTSTWITENCSDNVFDENTGEGYLVLNEGVDTVQVEGGKPAKNIFNDEGADSNVKAVILPSQITSIGDYAFIGCEGLTSVTIPNSVTSISQFAFFSCTGLTSVTIPNSVTSIGEMTFSGCSGLISVSIPNSVTIIGEEAFSGCSGLTSVTIPNSITSIGAYVFGDCTGLTSVTIPDSVTSIGNGAFVSCTGLTSATIPDSVTSIDNGAFDGCTGLTSVTCFATTPPTLGNDVFKSINTTTCGVPGASISAYQNDPSWSAAFTTFIAADV